MTPPTDLATRPQPAPAANGYPPVWELVIADVEELIATWPASGTDAAASAIVDDACIALLADMAARDALGRERYGTPLQPFNGRDALADLYQDLLDAIVYARQATIDADLAEDAHEIVDEIIYPDLIVMASMVRAMLSHRRVPGAPSSPAPDDAALPQPNTGRSA